MGSKYKGATSKEMGNGRELREGRGKRVKGGRGGKRRESQLKGLVPSFT